MFTVEYFGTDGTWKLEHCFSKPEHICATGRMPKDSAPHFRQAAEKLRRHGLAALVQGFKLTYWDPVRPLPPLPGECPACSSTLKRGQVRYTYHSTPDDLGRVHFTMEWYRDDLEDPAAARSVGRFCPHQGQCFFSDPAPYVARNREAGLEVIEVVE